MELDLIWILIGLPAAFGLGWLASRLDLHQLKIDNRQAPRAYFKGLNFLLNEQQDKAIDAFIEAVQNDPDTSELHFALGNLFRRRGEYERAVRVHEHLLSRGDLSTADRQRAQNALAKDYVKAGLLDRAEDALKKLEGTPFEGQARLARLSIYERSREWPQARKVAEQLELSGEVNLSVRKAHYLCEQALEVNAQRVGAGTGDDELGLGFVGFALHGVVVNRLVGVQAVRHDVEPLATHVQRHAVGQVSTLGQAHAHDGVAGL